ncbi:MULTISPECIES: hypothetical protein [unclassified Kitasatospora]|uniref:hypothetical protein n=1 Tax=unclassified Kitasatospora TaxID=2633591 RepID=UPI0021D924CF|nr:hypothetical protein [Kitasatospora sp. DSM 101779]MCU7823064.1 hypothetical protein [Kitasatospora sp. DSM 101779]
MADETTTPTEPVAAEHTAAPVDPNAIEQALSVLAEQPEEPAGEQPVKADPKTDETFEPLGNVTSCP